MRQEVVDMIVESFCVEREGFEFYLVVDGGIENARCWKVWVNLSESDCAASKSSRSEI